MLLYMYIGFKKQHVFKKTYIEGFSSRGFTGEKLLEASLASNSQCSQLQDAPTAA